MANGSEKSSVGMPQLDFSNFDNQTFWLFLFLILVFLVIRLLVMPRMEETLTNRRKIIEEDIQEAEELKDKALEVEKTLNNELEEARVKANDILRNCKDEIKRNNLTFIPSGRFDIGHTVLKAYQEAGTGAIDVKKQHVRSKKIRAGLSA